MTECCSLRDAVYGNVAIFIVYKWCHSHVIVIKLTAVTEKLRTNLYFGFFIFWILTELCYFVTYLRNDPHTIQQNFKNCAYLCHRHKIHTSTAENDPIAHLQQLSAPHALPSQVSDFSQALQCRHTYQIFQRSMQNSIQTNNAHIMMQRVTQPFILSGSINE